MAISYVGQAVGTTSVTYPTFQSGDIAVMFAFRDGSVTNPTIPTGWTSLTNTTDGTTCSSSCAWRRLNIGDTSGTWTNASRVVCLVYRGCEPFITPAIFKTPAAGTTNTVNWAAQTMTRTDNTSWLVGFIGHRSVDTTIEAAPSGMTNRANGVDATAEASGHDTNGAVASWSSTNQTITGTASGWQSLVVELLALPDQFDPDVNLPPMAPPMRRMD